ncbi:MAG TPA: zinc metallopeptidase [Anaerolineae bacterium]|nr:zinc metallopeptidase [Anaerolineae bacterium]MCB0222207.1 zinc metallopeptidase [Anaerolineae bacterium]MCB9102949.1 zinc metallopeptidase [Anaerolineales bacterium]HRV95640.1 zinc metallopeptidase [Anaerolineae bacterium]
MFFIDPNYFWYVFIPTLLISGGVQLYLKSTFNKWGGVRNSSGINGMQVGQQLFNRTSLNPIPLQRTPGALSDHFDPGANVVRLSDPIATKPTVAAMAVTAHELGHVQQYQTGSALIKARSFLLPALQFSPTLSYMAIFLGLVFNMANLVWIGIFFFGLMVLFSILTLPVEFDASRRGLKLLQEANLLQSDTDRQGARQLLTAAGMTYVAAAVTSILQLLYYISIARRNS